MDKSVTRPNHRRTTFAIEETWGNHSRWTFSTWGFSRAGPNYTRFPEIGFGFENSQKWAEVFSEEDEEAQISARGFLWAGATVKKLGLSNAMISRGHGSKRSPPEKHRKDRKITNFDHFWSMSIPRWAHLAPAAKCHCAVSSSYSLKSLIEYDRCMPWESQYISHWKRDM